MKWTNWRETWLRRASQDLSVNPPHRQSIVRMASLEGLLVLLGSRHPASHHPQASSMSLAHLR